MDIVFIYLINIFTFVYCGYPPTGDEVQAGSVLLPASRRGRYLANIVRRQAVDGTGIKFNKDADRMNAEAKKKVDVLSEELLPYIIAEQERRTTLYKRVMTAIQNGEKGVTVAEIRNKPPLIIRKGLMYRCPKNRAPKEPDGSGVIMCEDDIEPTPVMYDSCLSAEDKELYVAENKYFFCNRHKIEGPDLPRNGSTVIGCAPLERTSLNYTSQRCTLEDTDDVVVHYRYYPDRTYKFVTELDPDREVCDHWNPCQIGYIYSLPAPDQAVIANELWRDYVERPNDYENDEIVPPIPEDSAEEYVVVGEDYKSNLRKILIPNGFKYHGIGRWDQRSNARMRLTAGPSDFVVAKSADNLVVKHSISGRWLSISISFNPFRSTDAANYYVRFEEIHSKKSNFMENVLVLHEARTSLKAEMIDQLPGQIMNKTIIHMSCNKCKLIGVMLRAEDGSVLNLDTSKYQMRSYVDQSGMEKKFIELDLLETTAQDFGDYYALIENEDGSQEKIKLLSLQTPEEGSADALRVERLEASIEPDSQFEGTVHYDCETCELSDIICNGESVLHTGKITINTGSKTVNFNFPSFQDDNVCVYIGIFKDEDKIMKKELAVIENALTDVKLQEKPAHVSAPVEGEQFEQKIPFDCDGDCSVDKITVNGVKLEQKSESRRFFGLYPVRTPYFYVVEFFLIIRFPFFSVMYTGVFLCTFLTPRGPLTKTVLEIEPPAPRMPEIETTTEPTTPSTVEAETLPPQPPMTFEPHPDRPHPYETLPESTLEPDPALETESTSELDLNATESTLELDLNATESTLELDLNATESTSEDGNFAENATESTSTSEAPNA